MRIKVARFFTEQGSCSTIIEAAGWPIWPLILCSIIALAHHRRTLLVACARNMVARENLLTEVVQEYRQNGVTPAHADPARGQPRRSGQIFAAGLQQRQEHARPS